MSERTESTSKQSPPKEVSSELLALYQKKRYADAKRKALSLTKEFPFFPFGWKVLGAVLGNMGMTSEALKANQMVVELSPEDARAHGNLGITLREAGKLKESEFHCRQAIALESDFAEAHNNLGNTLNSLGRYEEAEVSFSQALALDPDYQSALYNRCRLLFSLGKYDAALIDAESCSFKKARVLTLQSLYAMGRVDEVYDRLEELSKIDGENLRVAAFAAFISQVEKRSTAYQFCPSPLSFLYVSNLASHVEDTLAFTADVIKAIDKLENVKDPFGSATNGGLSTPRGTNLFEIPSEEISQLKSIILNELEAYKSKFQRQSCNYIKNWPSGATIWGWQVTLKKLGYQQTHIHAGGWLSGVIYLKVVPPLDNNQGAIKFSLNGADYEDSRSTELIHQPELGDIVLFPSSLHHSTIPFTTETERAIVSFDLVP